MKSPENIVFWMTLYGFSGSLFLPRLQKKFYGLFWKVDNFYSSILQSNIFFIKEPSIFMDHPFLFSAYVWTQSSGFSRLCMHLVFCIQKDQFYVQKFWIADILFKTNKNPKNEIANII